MPKIVKTDAAPEGTLRVAVQGAEFSVDGRGHKTDDPAELAAVHNDPWFAIDGEPDVEQARESAEKAAQAEAAKAEKAEAARVEQASKDPRIRAVEASKETN